MERRARHSGSWYSNDASQLVKDLDEWLASASKHLGDVKAIICPHAGYSYSGSTAAWSWRQIVDSDTPIKRVVLLGPLHHEYFAGCALPHPSILSYRTPLGSLPLDVDAIETLRLRGRFDTLTLLQDEAEHSLEMQLPFLRHVIKNDVGIVPIFVGDVKAKVNLYASYMTDLFEDPETLFVISSDFCHWGQRFGYTYLPPDEGRSNSTVNTQIEALDTQAINHILKHDLSGFESYLTSTKNTICGQNPIRILLGLLRLSKSSFQTHLLQYSQSDGKVDKKSGSCVAYASLSSRKCR